MASEMQALSQWQAVPEDRSAVDRSHGRTCRETLRGARTSWSARVRGRRARALRTATEETDGDMERHTVRQI